MEEVIHLKYIQPEIAIITMEDRLSKNTFTEKFQNGIKNAFKNIEENKNVKVVITQGFDNYYACGAGVDLLMELTRSQKTFADFDFYLLPLQCHVPTIAAVQGHAIGDGLSFACMHDFILLASGAMYSANFLKYGFTPCMGSSYTIPKHFGLNAGYHMLYTAKQYTAEELKNLNCLLPFYPKNEVLEEALRLAKEIANKSLPSVMLLKEQLSSEKINALPQILEKERALQLSIMQTDEVKLRIKEKYFE